MKLSNISIIFIIIIIPIILVLSYYLSLQMDTINMQTAYSTKQLNATKEAVEAFEINTVEWNEAYSENADSKRRDIMASINTFTTSFANSLGIGGTSKEYIETYIPAIACTLYDGYYIYSPTETKEVIKDENGVAVFITEKLVKSDNSPISNYIYKDEHEGKLLYKCMDRQNPDGQYNGENFTFDVSKAVSSYEHILKPFSTYSARYKNGDTDITVNYTLDNYITIYGNIRNKETNKIEYVVESGYLIMPRNDLELYTETLKEKIWYEGLDKEREFTYVYAEDNTKVYFDGNTTFQVSSTGVRTDLNDTNDIKYKKIRKNSWETTYQALNTGDIKRRNAEGTIETITIEQGKFYSNKIGEEDTNIQEVIDIKNDCSSRNYYIESTAFTEWVKDNLSDITIGDMQITYQYNNKLSDEENEKKKQELKDSYGNANDKIFDIEGTDPESEDSVIVRHKREVIKQTLISNLNQAITSYSRNTEGEYQLPVLTETDWDHILRNVSIVTFVQGIPIGLKHYNNYVIATSTQNKEFVNSDEIYLTRSGDSYYHLPYCSHLSNDTSIIGYRNIDYVVKSYNIKDNNGNTTTNYYYKHSNIANEACYYCLVQRDLYSSEGLSDAELYAHEKAYKIALARERYRNISEINLKADLDYDIVVTLIENYEGGSTSTKLVAYQGRYGERCSFRLANPTKSRLFICWLAYRTR